MAIFGIGATFDSTDVSEDFINASIIGIGWNSTDAPELQVYLKSLRVGDIVYIKSANFGSDITVKAIGIIRDCDIISGNPIASIARNVKWVNTNKFIIPKPTHEKNNVRSNSIYEEFHPDVLKEIISKM